VRFLGVSNFSVEQMERCERVRHVDSVQPPLSLLDRGALGEVVPWAAANGTGVIVYSPMAGGLLTERWSVERLESLDPSDWRRRSPGFQPPVLEGKLRVRDGLIPIARRYGVDTGAVAVAWILAQPGVTGAIV